MRAVFLDRQTFGQPLDFSLLESAVEQLTCYQTTPPEHIIERCKDAEIIVTNKVILTREVLAKLPNLKLICVTATGYNNIDIKAALSLSIAVTNVSGYAKNSVAQYVFAQLLSYYNNIEHHHHNVSNGKWQQSDTFCLHGNGSTELANKTITIIGYGAIGQQVANIAQAFNMHVIIAERPHAQSIRKNRISFEQAIQSADIISLHCPQTPKTIEMCDTRFFQQVKKSAVLINTARGTLINNQALLSALSNNTLAFAILDVLDQEPPCAEHPLLQSTSEKLKITAHIAWASQQAQQALINLTAKNVIAFKAKERVNRIV